MKLSKFNLIILVIISLFLSQTVSAATDCLTSCTLEGNYYDCTGGFSCDTFSSSRSIYIHDATITYTGANGGIGIVGGTGLITIDSDLRVKMENVVVTSTGGDGGDGTGAGSGTSAGSGGAAGISVVAPYILVDNLTFTGTSGAGGKGSATTSCSGSESNTENSYGGAGGLSQLYINGTTSATFIDSNIILIGSNAGNAVVSACASADAGADSTDSKSAGTGINGAVGGPITFEVYSPIINISDVDLNADAGDGSNGAARTDVDRDCDGDGCTDWNFANVDCDDGDGGAGAGTTLTIEGTSTNISNFIIDIDDGNGGSGDAHCSFAEYGGDDHAQDCTVGIGGVGGTSTITITSDTISTSNNVFDTLAGNGGSGQDDCADAGDTPSSSTSYSTGPSGGSSTYIINTLAGYEENISIYLKGGTGGEGEEDAINYPTYKSTASGGSGGSVTITLNGTSVDSSNITVLSGAGYSGSNVGYGGTSGASSLYYYSDVNISSSNITTNIGVSGATGSKGPGNAGTSYNYNYNNLTYYNTVAEFNGGAAGTGACGERGAGGPSVFYNYGDFYLRSSTKVDMNGGAGTCSEGGDAYIDTNGKLELQDSYLTQTSGIYAASQGDCENVFMDEFVIQNSDFKCISSGTASITGSGMSILEYKNNSNISLAGTAGNEVTMDFNGTTQKFLTWDAQFSTTNINWDCAIAKYGNRTPAYVGTIVFNDTCTPLGYDEYYVELISVLQNWTNKAEPYSYVNYSCITTATFPSDTEGTIKANFTWYDNGVEYTGSALETISSGIPYTSAFVVNASDINVGDNFSCNVTILSDTTDLTELSNISETIPAYHYNMNIDVGNNSISDYEVSGNFDENIKITLDADGLNDYLRTCTDTTCVIPIRFYSEESGQIQFNNVSAEYGVDDHTEGLFNLSISVFSDESGNVRMSPISFGYNVSDGSVFTMTARSLVVGYNTSYNITLITSDFNHTMPTNIDYFEMYPTSITAQNVEPYGQSSSQSIFTVNSEHATENMDIYMRLNHSWASMGLDCTTLEFVNATSAPETGPYINTTAQLVCANVSAGDSCYLWGYEDFACTTEQVQYAVYEPEFIFDSICSDCVRASGWDD